MLAKIQKGTATEKKNGQFAKKLNIILPNDPTITLLDIYPR